MTFPGASRRGRRRRVNIVPRPVPASSPRPAPPRPRSAASLPWPPPDMNDNIYGGPRAGRPGCPTARRRASTARAHLNMFLTPARGGAARGGALLATLTTHPPPSAALRPGRGRKGAFAFHSPENKETNHPFFVGRAHGMSKTSHLMR